MRKRYVIPVVVALVLGVLDIVAYRAINGASPDLGDQEVAGQVGETQITSGQVNELVADARETLGLQSQGAWDQWLKDHNTTEEEFWQNRLALLDYQERVRQAAQNKGIQIEDVEIDGQIRLRKAEYLTQEMGEAYVNPQTTEDQKDAVWKQALLDVGLSEDTYRETIATEMRVDRLREVFRAEGEDLDSYLETL